MIKNNYDNTRMMEAEAGLKYDQPKMTGGKRMVDGVQREWFGPHITKAGELEEEMKKGNNCVIDLTKDLLPIKRKQDVKVKVKKEEGDKKVKTEKGERRRAG